MESLLRLLEEKSDQFDEALRRAVLAADTLELALRLVTIRKKAVRANVPLKEGTPLRLALVGAYSFFPFQEVLGLHLWALGFKCELLVGEFDNYVSELMDSDPNAALNKAKPQVVVVMPSEVRCRYQGALTDPVDRQRAQVTEQCTQLLSLAAACHERTGAEMIVCNFMPPSDFDPGPMRTRTLGSDWSFRKAVNLELGLMAPASVHLCDLEFLSSRRGTLASRDERRWFESKQPCSPALMIDVVRELGHLICSTRRAPKKVLALDLDNTLWGGVVGDDGIDGIELGDTSPRGEAFKAFQHEIKKLKARGVLLGICSKNDHQRALDAIKRHPEMVLREDDFVSMKINWEPKSDNLRQMAAELNLGLDSFVFADDNPAEIEIVRQFAPEVEAIHLGEDPSTFVARVTERRLFEPRTITAEDLQRSEQYQREAERRVEMGSAADMDSYLKSLEMVATIRPFRPIDVPRISQLINKSNQFNLTTRRRSEAEVTDVMNADDHVGFTIRLADRFGDHGLIAILIGRVSDAGDFVIDTWVMSCRVLKRQVEEETLNELVRVASARGCMRLVGSYLPTAKNGLVKDLYAKLGFATIRTDASGAADYELTLATYQPTPTHMQIRRSDD